MKGSDLRDARLRLGWTQEQAAKKLRLTQAYLSMVEQGRRTVSSRLLSRTQKLFELPPTTLPLTTENSGPVDSEAVKSELGALGYPGFSYLRGNPKCNPAQLLFDALNQTDLDVRAVEALPWLAWKYADMDWEWLIKQAKINDRQNRLGFVVTLAKELAKKRSERHELERLTVPWAILDRSRLVLEDTLCHDSMSKSERGWLRKHRPPEAVHWNLLTDMKLEHLPYASVCIPSRL